MNKLHFKVGLFAATSLFLAAVFVVYLLHARGFFEDIFELRLAAASADGVAPGVPVVFSGIEIGRVSTLGLNDDGGIVIRAEFLERNAKWLRETSTFTLDKPLVGGAKIRVDSPDLDAPTLADGSTVLLLSSDVSKEIPALVERVKAILANVEHLTRKDGEVNATLANVEKLTGRMTGEYGMLEGLLGSAEKARAVTDSLDKTRALITKLDGIALKTDRWLFAPDGVAEETRASLAQVRLMLNDAQASLKKADAVMANAVDISADVKQGTQDIAALRSEIDDAVRKANALVNEINKKWPFARDPEVKLP
ncbi:ABC-type transport system periplasmic component [Thiobacillus denitrificans ATCC 25259]|uniref:ABC-type transport system periplasmic component n=1 Tax=Thiobacillus denitrificans (strain ATCC 25259 / T1) TaxID=292415 RepID=Q3SK61_THIDA|nr:MlaD family protein [Thiobacillus denitrificans]AAZ96931.1 ABC-type transport system periplasmic component [Thiobacillus denitrificans ATCC 25259]